MRRTLIALPGSFCVLASKSHPEQYVQWARSSAGLDVEIADTASNEGQPMSASQLQAIRELGFSRDEPNYSGAFPADASAVPLVVGALHRVFGISDPADIEVTTHFEDEEFLPAGPPLGERRSRRRLVVQERVRSPGG